MKVKDMIEMLELADKDSEVVLEVRDKDVNLIGYFPVGSDHQETGGYGTDEREHVELTINNDEWVSLGIEQ